MAFGLTAPARSLLNSYGLERGVLLGILNRYYELAPRYVSSDILREFATDADGVVHIPVKFTTEDSTWLAHFWLEVPEGGSEYITTYVKIARLPRQSRDA